MPKLTSDGGFESQASPMLAREVGVLPQGEDWIYEFLWGGERTRAIKSKDGVRLVSREGRDFTNRFPRVAASVARLRSSYCVLDGEILYLDSYAPPVIRFLAEGTDEGLNGRLVFLAFDLLCDDGRDIRNFSLLCRRLLLTSAVQGTTVVLSPVIDARSETARASAERLGFRGIVAKRAGSAYRPNSLSWDWVKMTFALSPGSASGRARTLPQPEHESAHSGLRPNGAAD